MMGKFQTELDTVTARLKQLNLLQPSYLRFKAIRWAGLRQS